MIIAMKKDYIKPQIEVVDVETDVMMNVMSVSDSAISGNVGAPRRRKRRSVYDDSEWLDDDNF